jgi:hypothetical protein
MMSPPSEPGDENEIEIRRVWKRNGDHLRSYYPRIGSQQATRFRTAVRRKQTECGSPARLQLFMETPPCLFSQDLCGEPFSTSVDLYAT